MNNQRVLALAPSSKGFGFAVLEGPERLVYYGTKEGQGDKNSPCLNKIADLIEYYQPEVIVLENPNDKACRRCLRVQELLQNIVKLASSKSIRARTFSRSQIKEVFSLSDTFTKHQIAHILAEQFPELALRLPPLRKPWMGEDKRMSIFEAGAIALSFYFSETAS